jgi:hypothetical protein
LFCFKKSKQALAKFADGFRGVDMFNSLVAIAAHVLSWMFVIGVAGSVILVIPVAAFQLLSVLFEKDHPDELNPSFPGK